VFAVLLVCAVCELCKLTEHDDAAFANLQIVLLFIVSLHFGVMLVCLVLSKLGVTLPTVLASSSKRRGGL
jgi:hypothetical protein